MKEENKGITLMALVITIIVLIILAGITINAFFGEDGLLNQAKHAKDSSDLADAQEQITQAVLVAVSKSKINEVLNCDVLESELNKLKDDGIIDGYTYNGEELNLPVNVTKGENTFQINEDAEVSLIQKSTPPSGWEKVSANASNWYSYGGDKVNQPKLKAGMSAIVYDGLSSETNLWANAMTSDGSMWVWIPRYAYKITGTSHSSTASEIEVAFIDLDNNFLNKETGDITEDPNETGAGTTKWLVHPAFTSNPNNGGWKSELSGIWVGKFETTGTYDSLEQTGVLSVKPGISSLRNMTINQQFKIAKTSRFGETVTAETLGSHMAKNSEWGAIAYFSYSKYGTNGEEIGKNTNSSYITGGSTDISTVFTTNANQSSTGNPTGIYDLNGGGWEYVASYVDFAALSAYSTKGYAGTKNDMLEVYGGTKRGDLYGASRDEQSTSTEYKTVYKGAGTQNADSGESSYALTSSKKGDAIYETSSKSTGKTSWNSENSAFPNWDHPYFKRSGAHTSTVASGIFYFNTDTGNLNDFGTFRMILAF